MRRAKKDPYQKYVEHPRFGRGPRTTGLNPSVFDANVWLLSDAISKEELRQRWEHLPKEQFDALAFLNPNVFETRRIPNTAILADQQKQDQRSYSRATHYFDLDKMCVDCKRAFLFFAEEQRYWFEELGFPLSAQCARCVNCRKPVQEIASLRKNHDRLVHVEPRNLAQNLEMADICLKLVEAGIFPATKTAEVRSLLNRVTKQLCEPHSAKIDSERTSLLQRVLAIEAGAVKAKEKSVLDL